MLASGSMGEVWRARHLGLGKDVAVKLLRADRALDETIVQRFIREARTASRLEHPSTVRILDFGRDGSGLLYLAMELVGGPTLAQIIQERAPLSPVEARGILARVLAAAAAAHTAGVLHRDLKPSNIMLSPAEDDDGRPFLQVKVCDFGLAKLLDSAESLIDPRGQKHIIGTPLYMSPEQAVGGALDERSDIYACGVILYEMLTGHPPYQADKPVGVLMQHCSAPIPKVTADQPSLPPELDTIICTAMAKEPEERFSSARAFRSALLELELEAPEWSPKRRAKSDTGYFLTPSSTAEHERAPRPEQPRNPLPPDLAGRALLDELPIESPIESSPENPILDATDEDAIIPVPRVQHADAVAHPPDRASLARHGLADRLPSATGFHLRSPSLDPVGPLDFDSISVALRSDGARTELDHIAVSADPHPRAWLSVDVFLELIEAPNLARMTCRVPIEGGSVRGRLEPGKVQALLLGAEREKTTGRIVLEGGRAGAQVFFEMHLASGRPTYLETNAPDLQAPAIWLEEGILADTELPRLVSYANQNETTLRAAARAPRL